MPIVRTETDDGDEVELEVSPDEIELGEDDDPTDLPGVQDEINRVAGKTRKNAKQTAKKTLKSDEEAFREVAQAHGYEFREDGRIKGSAAKDKVKELKKRNAELEEKASKAEDLEEQMQQARDTRLENQLLQHADDVKEDMKDLYLSDAKSRFTYDARRGRKPAVRKFHRRRNRQSSRGASVDVQGPLRQPRPLGRPGPQSLQRQEDLDGGGARERRSPPDGPGRVC